MEWLCIRSPEVQSFRNEFSVTQVKNKQCIRQWSGGLSRNREPWLANAAYCYNKFVDGAGLFIDQKQVSYCLTARNFKQQC